MGGGLAGGRNVTRPIVKLQGFTDKRRRKKDNKICTQFLFDIPKWRGINLNKNDDLSKPDPTNIRRLHNNDFA